MRVVYLNVILGEAPELSIYPSISYTTRLTRLRLYCAWHGRDHDLEGSECRLFQWLVLAKLDNYKWKIQCMKHAT